MVAQQPGVEPLNGEVTGQAAEARLQVEVGRRVALFIPEDRCVAIRGGALEDVAPLGDPAPHLLERAHLFGRHGAIRMDVKAEGHLPAMGQRHRRLQLEGAGRLRHEAHPVAHSLQQPGASLADTLAAASSHDLERLALAAQHLAGVALLEEVGRVRLN